VQLRAKIMGKLKEASELAKQVDSQVDDLNDTFLKSYDIYDNQVALAERNNRMLA
jgi:hypothetical protein